MTDAKKIKAVLWDMDGTLFDTKRGIAMAVRETLDTLGLPQLKDEEIDNFIGPPIQFGFRDNCHLTMEEAQNAADIFRKSYREKGYVTECDPYPGLLECLKNLKEKDFRNAVCTLKKQDMAERIIDNFGMSDLFDSIVGTDAFDNIKKHDTIRMTAERFGIDVSEAVLIGDTEFDSLGAEKAGSLFIGVTFGFGFKSKTDVDEYPNIGTAASVDEVFKIIREYNAI